MRKQSAQSAFQTFIPTAWLILPLLTEYIQRGVVVIPKSTHIERMAENFNVFDFVLSNDDMSEIVALDKNESSFFSHQDPSVVEWFVNMVEERKEKA